MEQVSSRRARKYLVRAIMVVPPILFLAYATHALVQIRSMLGESTSFHLDYANDLVQDFLALHIALETERLHTKLLTNGTPDPPVRLVTTTAKGEALTSLNLPNGVNQTIYLRHDTLADTLPPFFRGSKGLRPLFTARFHEPIYWFKIMDSQERPVFISGSKPAGKVAMATYPMDRSLQDYHIEIAYNSFGAKQLYSVAQTKVNLGGLLLLFALAVISGGLLTFSIRQKIILARQKSFFVSTVSHEFKTPLAIMKLAAETLAARRFKSPAEEMKFSNMLTSEINRLNHLVHKILSFNEIELGQVHYHARPLNLQECLAPSIEIFQTQALAEHVELELNRDKRPCMILGDPDLLRLALDNILDNAFKYRGTSSRIIFSCLRKAETVQVSVTDFGVGIASDEIAHIHKGFYRVADPLLQGVRGSGLGLAISHHILTLAGATLNIQSEHGKGSTFTVYFKPLECSVNNAT